MAFPQGARDGPAGGDTHRTAEVVAAHSPVSAPPYLFPTEAIGPEAEEWQSSSSPEETMEAAEETQRTLHWTAPPHPCRRRRVAVVGECVARDPDYWRYPFRPLYEKSLEERNALRARLASHMLMAGFPPFVMELFLDALRRRAWGGGDTVVEPCDVETFLLVEHGTLVEREGEDEGVAAAGPKPRGWGAGETYGAEGLLHFLTPRLGFRGVRGLTAGDAWTLSRVEFKRIVMVHRLQSSFTVRDTLYGTALFDGLPPAARVRLEDAVERFSVPEGGVLIEAGASPEYVAVVHRGMVEVSKPLPNGLRLQVKVLAPGSAVGEREVLLPGGAPSSYVYSAYGGGVTLLRIHRHHFHALFSGALTRDVRTRVDEPGYAQRLETARRILLETGDDVAESDTESERSFDDDMCPVTVKDAAATVLLLDFFRRPEYAGTTGMKRGLALAAFLERRHLPEGTVLFASADGVRPPCVRGVAVPTDAEAHGGEQYLYVIDHGAITVFEKGQAIATLSRAGSVGAHQLLKKPSTPHQPLTAVVTSPGGCSVYCLERRPFRLLLMPAYTRAQRIYRDMLVTMPFDGYLTNSNRALLCQCTRLLELDPGDVLLAASNTPQWVYAIVDGRVAVLTGGSRPAVGGGDDLLSAGDLVGALEVLDRAPAPATYVTQCKSRLMRIPAAMFEDLLCPALCYVKRLRRLHRYSFYHTTAAR